MVDMPLLFETGFQKWCSETVLVFVDQDRQVGGTASVSSLLWLTDCLSGRLCNVTNVCGWQSVSPLSFYISTLRLQRLSAWGCLAELACSILSLSDRLLFIGTAS